MPILILLSLLVVLAGCQAESQPQPSAKTTTTLIAKMPPTIAASFDADELHQKVLSDPDDIRDNFYDQFIEISGSVRKPDRELQALLFAVGDPRGVICSPASFDDPTKGWGELQKLEPGEPVTVYGRCCIIGERSIMLTECEPK